MKITLLVLALILSSTAFGVDLCDEQPENLVDKVEDYWAGAPGTANGHQCKPDFFLDNLRGQIGGTVKSCWYYHGDKLFGEKTCFGTRTHEEEIQCVSSFNTGVRSSIRRMTVRKFDVRVSCTWPKCDDSGPAHLATGK